MTKVEDLDVQIAHQKFPVFLLGETPSRRSAVLSIGQEASYIRDMVGLHKERCSRDIALVRSGERELIELTRDLEALKEIEPLKERLGAADAQANAIRVAADRLAALEDHARRLAAARTCSSAAAARLRVTAGLPDPAVLTRLHDQLERGRAHDELAEKLRRTTAALALARARDALLADLPDSVPVPESTTAAEETLGRLRSVGEQAAAMRHRLTGLDQRMNTVRADLARLMDETGGRCPTCGSPVDSDALLTGHAHPGQEAA